MIKDRRRGNPSRVRTGALPGAQPCPPKDGGNAEPGGSSVGGSYTASCVQDRLMEEVVVAPQTCTEGGKTFRVNGGATVRPKLARPVFLGGLISQGEEGSTCKVRVAQPYAKNPQQTPPNHPDRKSKEKPPIPIFFTIFSGFTSAYHHFRDSPFLLASPSPTPSFIILTPIDPEPHLQRAPLIWEKRPNATIVTI